MQTLDIVSAHRAFRCGKYGPKVNPAGAHILAPSYYQGVLEVVGAEYREYPAGFVLVTRTFDRTMGFTVPMSAARVLLRRD